MQAHYHNRKADNHLRCRRFDDAIECHKKATTALDEALAAAANNSKAIESVRLQRDFHLKRIELIRLKKKQYDSYKTAQRLKTMEPQISKARLESTCDLQIAIYKTLEESDSVLEALNARKPDEQTSDNSSSEATGSQKTVNDDSNGTLIIDLHTLNHQLHILVFNLMSKMDESNYEMESLRDRVKMLEKERGGPLRSPAISKGASNKTEQKSEEKHTERTSRRSSIITGEERKIVLPATSDFPPLELPEFDYSSFDKEN